MKLGPWSQHVDHLPYDEYLIERTKRITGAKAWMEVNRDRLSQKDREYCERLVRWMDTDGFMDVGLDGLAVFITQNQRALHAQQAGNPPS
jgi:hypothetical protein